MKTRSKMIKPSKTVKSRSKSPASTKKPKEMKPVEQVNFTVPINTIPIIPVENTLSTEDMIAITRAAHNLKFSMQKFRRDKLPTIWEIATDAAMTFSITTIALMGMLVIIMYSTS